MGTYVRAGRRKRPSINEALAEAEQDHFLDCPNAEFRLRAAALLLDAILFGLLFSGIHHSCLTLGSYANSLAGSPATEPSASPLNDPLSFARYASHVLQLSLIYLYFIWSTSRFGGSPAKLLLGLRVGDAETGQRLSITRAFLRELFGKTMSTLAGGLGWGMPFIRDDQRAMHDLISKSVVKRIHGGA